MNNLSNMLTLGGSMVQGYGALQAGNFNRAQLNTAADDALRTGVAEEQRVRDRARRAIGEQAAALAGNGFTGNSGSALDVLRDSQVEAALDVLEVRRQASSRAVSYRNQGEMAAAQGRAGFASALLGGAAKAWQHGQDWAAVRRPYQSSGGGG